MPPALPLPARPLLALLVAPPPAPPAPGESPDEHATPSIEHRASSIEAAPVMTTIVK